MISPGPVPPADPTRETMGDPDRVDNRLRRRRHLADERGQGMVEYALILVLIAVVVIVILSVMSGQVNNLYSNIGNGLNQ